MRTIFSKAMARAVGLALTLAISGWLGVFIPGQALAGFCSTTKCGLTLTSSNASGAIGSGGNLGDSLTIGNARSGGLPSSLYQGVQSSAPGCTTGDCQGSLFGYANGAATGGTQRSQDVSPLVSQAASSANLRQLVQSFAPSGPNVPASSVADACFWWQRTGSACGATGLSPVTRIPEPGSLVLLASALLALGILGWKRVI